MWGWSGRGPESVETGGTVGTKEESSTAHAWPRYEADYLKRALLSKQHKYDTRGLDSEQRAVYLDKVVRNYKAEADECLRGEFDQWLAGSHPMNAPEADTTYHNASDKPVRRWVFQEKDAQDGDGGSKVGQARAGWSHTPWGRGSLVHLDGVREYLRGRDENANEKDKEMQILAELGPQSIEQAWLYFKHWVKGRQLTDAVTLPERFAEPIGREARSDFGNSMPARFYDYESGRPDAQSEVYATDINARTAARDYAPEHALDELFEYRQSMEAERGLKATEGAEDAMDNRELSNARSLQGLRAQFAN
jgi:hypothetical protein